MSASTKGLQFYKVMILIMSVLLVVGVLMILGASFEFDQRHNNEIILRPSDNEDIPRVRKIIFVGNFWEICFQSLHKHALDGYLKYYFNLLNLLLTFTNILS